MSDQKQKAFDPWDDDVAADKEYGKVVPFERAYNIMTLVKLVERMARQHAPFVVGFGLLLVVSSLMRIGPNISYWVFPGEYAWHIKGKFYLIAHDQFVWKLHLGTFLGSYVIACVCAEVAEWCRGEEPDPVATFTNFKIGLKGMAYEGLTLFVTWILCAPILLVGIVGASADSETMVVLSALGQIIVAFVAWMATRPGLWAMAVDDLPVQYAMIQSIIIPLRHPVTVVIIFIVWGASTVVGLFFLVVPAFLLVGAFQCSVAAAWVLFGATEQQIDGSGLLKKVVKLNRKKKL